MQIAKAQKLYGWPSYTIPAVVPRLKLDQDALPSLLYHRLTGIEEPFGSGIFSRHAELILGDLFAQHPAPQVTEATVIANRAIAAENLNIALKILADNEILRLAKDIEKIGRKLAKTLLVDNVHVSSLHWSRAITPELSKVFRGSLAQALPFFKIDELEDVELINKLTENEDERKRFIQERTNYQPQPEMDFFRHDFQSKVKRIRELLNQINLDNAKWSYAEQIISGLKANDEIFTKQLRGYFRPLDNIYLFLGHDSAHSFASKLLKNGGTLLGFDDEVGNLSYHMHAFKNLASHLSHLRSLLSLNKYRLDGDIPSAEIVDISEVVRSAVFAAGYRWGRPLNLTYPIREGCINFISEIKILKKIIPAFLGPIIYNLIKNSIKAVVEATGWEKDEEVMKTMTITVKVESDHEQKGVAVITVEDSGTGFQLNRLLEKGFQLVKQRQDEGALISDSTLSKLLEWEKKPALLRTLSIGEILDLSFELTISGFSDQSISSGLGLSECAECAHLMGVKIIVTNTSKGGALISIFLGEEDKVDAVIARELGYSSI
jgi:signal transduction histidine kinase